MFFVIAGRQRSSRSSWPVRRPRKTGHMFNYTLISVKIICINPSIFIEYALHEYRDLKGHKVIKERKDWLVRGVRKVIADFLDFRVSREYP